MVKLYEVGGFFSLLVELYYRCLQSTLGGDSRCTQKSACTTNFGPMGEIGAYFSLQLSSQTQNKKVIAKIQCKKTLNIELSTNPTKEGRKSSHHD